MPIKLTDLDMWTWDPISAPSQIMNWMSQTMNWMKLISIGSSMDGNIDLENRELIAIPRKEKYILSTDFIPQLTFLILSFYSFLLHVPNHTVIRLLFLHLYFRLHYLRLLAFVSGKREEKIVLLHHRNGRWSPILSLSISFFNCWPT